MELKKQLPNRVVYIWFGSCLDFPSVRIMGNICSYLLKLLFADSTSANRNEGSIITVFGVFDTWIV